MKDTKFYPLLAISVVLLLASFILLCILGYNFYTKSQEQKQQQALVIKTKGAAVNNTRDSLQKIYAATIGQFQQGQQLTDATTLPDSVKTKLDTKLTDFLTLRNEIAGLLKSNSSVADLDLAKQKIDELQQKVDELKNRNIDIEKENKRLNELLAKYSVDNNTVATSRSTAISVRSTEDRPLMTDAAFTAIELRLAANNESNNEVSEAEATEKFVGSLAVKNNANLNDAELMVIVVQPDGRILKNAWESGTFDTNEGRKVYSRKIKFDYTKGEVKRLNFSLDADNCQKGNYTMQLYSKGKLIGKTIKTVS